MSKEIKTFLNDLMKLLEENEYFSKMNKNDNFLYSILKILEYNKLLSKNTKISKKLEKEIGELIYKYDKIIMNNKVLDFIKNKNKINIPYSVLIIAKKICELSNWEITNLELQKILYIINMLYLGKNNKPLIKEKFEAWMYGPVVPELYEITRVFGADEIEKWMFNDIDNLEDKKTNDFVENCYNQLKDFKPSELVALTHIKNGAWDKNYKSDETNLIPNEDIIKEFKDNYITLKNKI